MGSVKMRLDSFHPLLNREKTLFFDFKWHKKKIFLKCKKIVFPWDLNGFLKIFSLCFFPSLFLFPSF